MTRPTRPGPVLHWPGKRAPRAEPPPPAPRLTLLEETGLAAAGEGLGGGGRLIRGDNRLAMRALLPEHAGKVDLVYVDPPFGTGGSFSLTARGGGEGVVAYSDRWSDDLGDYLSTMLEQLELLRALLSDRGTLFVHCDWRVSHHMRCLLDEVFGADAFKNELVWRYRRWPAKTRVFQKMHDVIFWYGKLPGDAHAWTPQYEPLAASTLATWGTKRQVADFSSGRRKPSQMDEETPGAPMADVWDIGIIAPIARERVGYPTQKPEALLRRVIEAASKPGDLVLDVFAGSGTTLAVAEKMGRRWIGCDVGRAAIHASRKRLLGIGAAFEVLAIEGGEGEREGEAAVAPVVITAEAAGTGAGARRNVRLRVAGAGAEAIDYWAVDWEHDGQVFRSAWHASREGKRRELSLVAEHAYAAAGRYRIAVQASGAAGGERRQVVEWVVE